MLVCLPTFTPEEQTIWLLERTVGLRFS